MGRQFWELDIGGFDAHSSDCSCTIPDVSRAEYMRNYQSQWLKKRRQNWIDENGPCQACGSQENLEVDHIDRSQKSMHAGEVWSRRREVREAELAKCQVLCETCHLAKTLREREVSNACGTLRAYWVGCRCPECRSASAQEARERRARKRATAGVVE